MSSASHCGRTIREVAVDDEGHDGDIVSRVLKGLTEHYSTATNDPEQAASIELGVEGLRAYFRQSSGFFADHLARYSRSRRYAPIYWPLSTASGPYTLWLYYHRLTDQTLYTCVNDFVEPKLKQVTEEAGRLRGKSNRSSAEERELERLSDLELELKDFRDELLRIAKFWKPNLNDGVQITASPLWKLFQHRDWRNRLKETWEQLEGGGYDWSHLAMSIWPGRVVPKCTEDRSVAIAHGLEELFWVEDDGAWRQIMLPSEERTKQIRRLDTEPTRRVQQLLAELAASADGSIACDHLCTQLAMGFRDESELALLLWPERIIDKYWDDPLMARPKDLKLPQQRTKAAKQKFLKGLVGSTCPELASAVVDALKGRQEPFRTLWARLAAGEIDDLPLALSLWPGRVVDRCTQDMDMAERHGLRQFFWVRHPSDQWRKRRPVQEEIDQEVARRRRM